MLRSLFLVGVWRSGHCIVEIPPWVVLAGMIWRFSAGEAVVGRQNPFCRLWMRMKSMMQMACSFGGCEIWNSVRRASIGRNMGGAE